MKKRRHTPEQVIRKLAEGDKLLNQGEDLAEVCRQLEIAESTWHPVSPRRRGRSSKGCSTTPRGGRAGGPWRQRTINPSPRHR
jgi:hypothetical protein